MTTNNPRAHYCARAVVVSRDNGSLRSDLHNEPTVRAAFALGTSMATRADVELVVIERRANQYAEWTRVATIREDEQTTTEDECTT